jgi:phosphoribosylamine--glycine ligase
MKILVLGGGGREHAIVWSLRKTSTTPIEIYCAPGNAGIAQIAQRLPIPLNDHQSLIDFAESQRIDLTFVGPEAPLAEGLVDRFQKAGLRIAGPNAVAAQLESSKVFAKNFMARHSIPTAPYRVVTGYEQAREMLRSGVFGLPNDPVVIKADGLAAGKGVVVARSKDEAESAAAVMLRGELVPKEAAERIVIEEAVEGTEISVLLFCDGQDYQLMPAARDHKRIGENDSGPNTGGMGAITDDSLLDSTTLQTIQRYIIEPTLAGAQAEGFPFQGVLFLGLMLTKDGPTVLEYNVRFGDPETQAILIRLNSDLAEVLNAVATRSLGSVSVKWNPESSACVVLASSGYPGKYPTGFPISGLDEVESNVQIFHAGTERTNSGKFVTAGGRVLAVSSTGADLNVALSHCYSAVEKLHWEGMQYRRDIGRRGTGVSA